MSVFYMFMAMGGSGTQDSNGVGAAYFFGTNGFASDDAYTAIVAEFVFSTETAGYLSAVISRKRMAPSGASSSLKGYFLGGHSGWIYGVSSNYIDSIVFSTKTVTALGVLLWLARAYSADANSATRGYVAGGHVAAANGTGNNTNFIECIVFATEQGVNQSVALSAAVTGSAGVSSDLAGYFSGGRHESNNSVTIINGIDKLMFATEIKNKLTATLGSARTIHASFNSQTTGYFGSGLSDSNGTVSTTLDAMSFATEVRTTAGASLLFNLGSSPYLLTTMAASNSKLKGYVMVDPGNTITQIGSYVFTTGVSACAAASLVSNMYSFAAVQSGAL